MGKYFSSVIYEASKKQYFSMREGYAPAEIYLQYAWKLLQPGAQLFSTDKHTIEVISPGIWNLEAGPDFKNAKLKIDGVIARGDIEVHLNSADWYHHGHHLNDDYEHVILHVVAQDTLTKKKKLPFPTLLLTPEKRVADSRYRSGRCATFFDKKTDEQLIDMFTKIGEERFEVKSEGILKEMLQHGGEDTFRLHLFDALGYKKNRDAFKQLYHRCLSYEREVFEKHYKAILWGESTLIVDPTVEDIAPELGTYILDVWEAWGQLRREKSPDLEWIRTGSRPHNSPERRLVALIHILEKTKFSLLEYFISILLDDSLTDKLRQKMMLDTLMVSDSVWDNYYTFNSVNKLTKPTHVLGRQRALSIVINVVLPTLFAYGTLNRDEQLMERAKRLWFLLPKNESNYITRIAANQWLLPPERSKQLFKTAAIEQGVIHFYKEYCERVQTDCNICLMYRSLAYEYM